MSAQLLQDLLQVGEMMKDALELGQFEDYERLLGERGTLLDALLEHRHPSELGPDWEEMAKALSDQNDGLAAAAETQRQRMQEALTRIEQVKEAKRSYSQPLGQRTILSENLRV